MLLPHAVHSVGNSLLIIRAEKIFEYSCSRWLEPYANDLYNPPIKQIFPEHEDKEGATAEYFTEVPRRISAKTGADSLMKGLEILSLPFSPTANTLSMTVTYFHLQHHGPSFYHRVGRRIVNGGA